MTKDPGKADGGQLHFAFPSPEIGFSDLIETPANRSALQAIGNWRAWPGPVLCLAGPPKCGATTTARAWAREVGAAFYAAKTFDAAPLNEIEAASARMVIDDASEIGCGDRLLSVLNFAAGQTGRLLLTAHSRPSAWCSVSADLASRLGALPVVEIGPPDEEMIARRLVAGGARRHLKLSENAVRYLTARLDRSYAEVERFIEALDLAVRRTGRPPTRSLAREVLEASGGAPEPADED